MALSRSQSLNALMVLRAPMVMEQVLGRAQVVTLREGYDYNAALPQNSLETELLDYIHNEREELAIGCLARGARAHAVDEVGLSLLHHAAAAGMLKLMDELILRGASVDAKSIVDESVLTYVILMNAEPPAHDEDGNRIPREDGKNKLLAVIAKLIKHDVNVDAPDWQDFSPALHTARIGDVEVLEQLHDAHAHIAKFSAGHVDATHLAGRGGHSLICAQLQQWGIDPRCKLEGVESARQAAERIADKGGPDAERFELTACQLATGEVNAEARERAGLSLVGADLDQHIDHIDIYRRIYEKYNESGDVGLASTALKIVGELAGFKPVDPESVEFRLFAQVREGTVGDIERLINDDKANARATDEFGRTVIINLILNDENAALGLLQAAGCDVNTQDCLLNTALHYAVEKNDTDAVRLLLKAGACPLIENAKGQIPSDLLEIEPTFSFNPAAARTLDEKPDVGMGAVDPTIGEMLAMAEDRWRLANVNFESALRRKEAEQAGVTSGKTRSPRKSPPAMLVH